MKRHAAMLLLLATAGCTGLDGLGPNTYSSGLYSSGYAAEYPPGYGPPPGYAALGPYDAPPAYPQAWPAPGWVYRDRDHTWDHERQWEHDRRWEEGHREARPDAAQRQQAIIAQEQKYNQRVLQQQQLYNQQVLAAEQRYNQQVVSNPQGKPVFRAQLDQELAAQRQQLDRNTNAIRRQELGR